MKKRTNQYFSRKNSVGASSNDKKSFRRRCTVGATAANRKEGRGSLHIAAKEREKKARTDLLIHMSGQNIVDCRSSRARHQSTAKKTGRDQRRSLSKRGKVVGETSKDCPFKESAVRSRLVKLLRRFLACVEEKRGQRRARGTRWLSEGRPGSKEIDEGDERSEGGKNERGKDAYKGCLAL